MTTERFETEIEGHRVLIEFRSSSTRDGKEGYRVQVAGDSLDDAERVAALAENLRARCLAVIREGSNQ